jgi:hypothetical protein
MRYDPGRAQASFIPLPSFSGILVLKSKGARQDC